MKLTTTHRNEFEPRAFMGGVVSPYNSDIELAPVANGVVLRGTWYELPDNPDGDYVLAERLNTNQFGYHEGGSEWRLITRAEADALPEQVGAGIYNQILAIRVRDRQVEQTDGADQLVRAQD